MNEKKIKEIYEKIINKLKNYQFKNFLIGVKDKNLSENQKKDLKIILGQKLEKKLKKKVEFKDPEILILINIKEESIKFQIKPLYIFGRYQKIKAGIPQTRWYKKRYKTSVQEEIGNIILKESRGENHSFHGCGREDIDVLMLGNGRPFVIEIKNPKIRKINLKKIEKEINNTSEWVKVKNLKFTTKEKIEEIKKAEPDKTYEAEIQLEKPVSKIELKNACKKLSNITIKQQTPQRVIRRRADLIRIKKIHKLQLILYHPTNPIIKIKTQSGTYIKELISGDKGRTTPSLSEILNQKCFVKILKVIKIAY